MSVGFQVGKNYYICGTSSFLYCFFSTVAYNLENKKWGSKYPYIMNELYQGTLKKKHVTAAIDELNDIKKELLKYSPDKVVWDFKDLKKQPPWVKNICDTITSLANYFVTSEGDDFIEEFEKALTYAKNENKDIIIT